MEFFEKIFDGLTSLSAKLPAIDVKAIFIIAMVAMVAIGIIIGLTFLGSSAFKMKRACKGISKYLANVNEVNDDNAEDFTNTCFGKKTPVALSDSWVEYVGVRYGFPSEVMTENRVFDREVKKISYARANIFIAIALIVSAFLAFWGFGCLSGAEIGVIIGLGLLLSAIIYLILVIVARKQFSKAREVFYEMQDDLDAKVDFHVENSYAADTSPLVAMSEIIDDIINRNAEKEVEMPTEEDLAEEGEEEFVDGEVIEEEPIEDEIVDEAVADEEVIEDDATADVVEDEMTEEVTDEAIEEGEEDDMFGRRKKAREAAQIPQEERTFLDSEIVEDEEREYLDSEVVEDEVPTNQEIIEEEENLDEGDEEVKAPKLANLPGVADFILSKNFSTKQRLQLSGAMVGLCVKHKKDPDNFKLARKSTAKVLASVVADKIKERQAANN